MRYHVGLACLGRIATLRMADGDLQPRVFNAIANPITSPLTPPWNVAKYVSAGRSDTGTCTRASKTAPAAVIAALLIEEPLLSEARLTNNLLQQPMGGIKVEHRPTDLRRLHRRRREGHGRSILVSGADDEHHRRQHRKIEHGHLGQPILRLEPHLRIDPLPPRVQRRRLAPRPSWSANAGGTRRPDQAARGED